MCETLGTFQLNMGGDETAPEIPEKNWKYIFQRYLVYISLIWGILSISILPSILFKF